MSAIAMGRRIRSILETRASASPPPHLTLYAFLLTGRRFSRLRLDATCTLHILLHAMRRYVRDIVLGVNDGIVSMFLLQTSAWNSGLTNRQSLLFGICGEVCRAWPKSCKQRYPLGFL